MDDQLQGLAGASGTDYVIADHERLWPTLEGLPKDADQALLACRQGRALMFQGERGVFVLSLRAGHNPGTLEAFVLLALASRHGAFDHAEPAVLTIARDLGATTVAFRSVRRGWARRLGAAWKPRADGTEFWRWINGR